MGIVVCLMILILQLTRITVIYKDIPCFFISHNDISIRVCPFVMLCCWHIFFNVKDLDS